jgi:hypothetical protein
MLTDSYEKIQQVSKCKDTELWTHYLTPNLPNIVYALNDEFHQEYMTIYYCWELKLVKVDQIYALAISVVDFCCKKKCNISKVHTLCQMNATKTAGCERMNEL